MRTSLVWGAATALIVLFPSPASAGVDVDPSELSPNLFIEGEREVPGTGGGKPVTNLNGGNDPRPPPFVPIVSCRDDDTLGIYGCRNVDPGQPADDGPELTPGDVLRAVREIGLPSLQVKIEPGDATLVNVPTNFYAEPQPFERSVTLLGFDVDIEATPASFQWTHGDGTTRTTTQPGRPYPALDVTHRYTQPADAVQTRVDVAYQVRFRVDDGPWQGIAENLLATGPTAVLDVNEAGPVLTKP